MRGRLLVGLLLVLVLGLSGSAVSREVRRAPGVGAGAVLAAASTAIAVLSVEGMTCGS